MEKEDDVRSEEFIIKHQKLDIKRKQQEIKMMDKNGKRDYECALQEDYRRGLEILLKVLVAMDSDSESKDKIKSKIFTLVDALRMPPASV